MALLALIPLLGYILLWQRMTGSRSSSAAIHASSAILVALYLAAIADILLQVTTLLLICGSLLTIYESIDLTRRRVPLPVPLGVFLILCIVFALFHHANTFYLYDEFAHWGIFLKEMLAGDAVWGSESTAMVLRYPPGAPLWQYFFLRFTGFTESGAYLAQFSLLMLPLLVLWQGIRWRQVHWLFAILALVAFALSNYGHGFASVYVDHLLGAWFAGTLFNFMRDLKDQTPLQLLSYLLPVATLVLIKDAGLYFALTATGIMALLIFWNVAFKSGEKNIRGALVKAGALTLVCIVCAGLISTTWNANRNAAGIPESTYSTSGIISGITSGTSEFSEAEQKELSSRFLHVVLHQQISKNATFEPFGEFNFDIMHIFTDKFRMTTSSLILFFVLWQVVVLYKLVDPGDRWLWLIGAAGFTLTTLVYLGILFLSYHFAFGERAMILPSYLRYVHSAILPMVLFFFLPLLPGFAPANDVRIALPGGKTISRSIVVFAVIIGALFALETPHLTPLYKAHETPDIRQQMKPFIDKVRNRVEENASVWIYLPVPDPTGIRRRIFLYEMSPVRTEVVTDPEFLSQDPARINDVITNWDYLWFPIQDFEAEDVMQSLAGKDLKDHVFYVDRSDDEMKVIALSGVFN